jgi:hypothetical protein
LYRVRISARDQTATTLHNQPADGCMRCAVYCAASGKSQNSPIDPRLSLPLPVAAPAASEAALAG